MKPRPIVKAVMYALAEMEVGLEARGFLLFHNLHAGIILRRP